MHYKRFYIRIKPVDNLIRQDKQGSDIRCKGYEAEIFDSENEKLKLDEISIAVGFEILQDDIYEAEQLIKDYIDCEEKEYLLMLNKI
mgnify:CR=1 FL=1